jgi:hypothetical protein
MPYTISNNEGWNAGARSKKVCDGDFQLQFSLAASTAGACIGLNNSDTDASFREIKHAFMFQRNAGQGNVFVYESGVRKAILGTFVNADRFTIRRNGSVITYLKNDTILYTSAVPSIGPMFVDTSLYAAGDSI